jgi:Zn-dependent protease with chaperone function
MMTRRTDRAEQAGRDARWVPLYTVTFALQAACGFVRALFLSIPLVFLFALLGLVPIWADGNTPVTWACLALGAAPLLLSVASLVRPVGAGRYWYIRTGGRTPSIREREAYEHAIETLRERDPQLPTPRAWFVLDDPDVNAAALGDTLMLSTGTLWDPCLEAVIAHELGHLHTIDARLTVALNRFALPGAMLDRLCRTFPQSTLVEFLYISHWLWSGDFPLLLLRPLWDAWFRAREYQADQYAARLGQGNDLARVLERAALPDDHPIPYRFLSGASHPSTEHRLEALRHPNRHRRQRTLR